MATVATRKPATRSIGLLLMLAAAAVLYGWFVLRPISQRTADVRRSIAQKQSFILATQTATGSLEPLQHEKDELDEYLARRAAVNRHQATNLVGRLPQMVSDARLQLMRFQPQPATQHEFVRELALTLNTEGGFFEVCRFLYELEQLPQSVWVTSLDIQKDRKTEQAVQCEVDLTIFGDILDNSD